MEWVVFVNGDTVMGKSKILPDATEQWLINAPEVQFYSLVKKLGIKIL